MTVAVAGPRDDRATPRCNPRWAQVRQRSVGRPHGCDGRWRSSRYAACRRRRTVDRGSTISHGAFGGAGCTCRRCCTHRSSHSSRSHSVRRISRDRRVRRCRRHSDAHAAIVAIGPPGGPLRRARTALRHLKRVFRRDVKVPATNEATNNPAGRARRSARVRHALASPCRTP
ncbi:hypothetical protein F3J14_20130 [Burkholderia sp. Tr-862]|nr:hypothetical protein [Burkholderia sp. Tr-862]